MRNWVLTYNALLPVIIMSGTFLVLGGMGAFLLEFGSDDQRLKGTLALGFSALGLVFTVFVFFYFSRKRRALVQLRELSKMFEKTDAQSMISRLKMLIESDRIGEMHDVLYFLLARAYQYAEDSESAKKAYKIANNFWLAHNNLAVILLEEGEYDDAVDELRAAIALNPREGILYHQLAWTLQKMDEPVLARKVLEAARIHVPGTKLVTQNIQRILDGKEVEIPAFPSRVSFL